MESDELKSEKRVRHCYPKSEVYHRWAHDETLVYYNNGSRSIWGRGRWLFRGHDIRKKATDEYIIDCWGYFKNYCIATIDRDKKIVLIKARNNEYCFDIRRAIPDDYKIFYTNDCIDNPLVIEKEELLYKTYTQFLIERFVDYTLTSYYNYLAGRTRVVRENPDDVFSFKDNSYSDIVNFAKKHHLFRYSWSKVSLNTNYSIRTSIREYWKTTTISIPSLYSVYRKLIFKKEELFKLKVGWFYGRYCYGNGIPFKELLVHWDTDYTYSEFKTWYEHSTSYDELDDCKDTDIKPFQEWIKLVITAKKHAIQKQWNANVEKSNENYKEALVKLNALQRKKYTVNDWREGKVRSDTDFSVQCRIFKTCGPNKGQWVNHTLHRYINTNCFSHIQLKLDNKSNKPRVITSRGAVVYLDSAITMFRMFAKEVLHGKIIDDCKHYANIRVGIYNLRFIAYKDRTNDDGTTTKEWVIQIGCHDLWLPEILDFIHYYKLEKEFHLDDYKLLTQPYNERNN